MAHKWMAKMTEVDNKIALLPWYDSNTGEYTIPSYKNIPTSLFLFKKYFQRANPNEKGGKVYTDLFFFHSKPIKELKGDMSWWLKKLTYTSKIYNRKQRRALVGCCFRLERSTLRPS